MAEAVRRRRSIRRFASTPVSDDVLFQLLESARLAPSASNKQPWRFVVVQDPQRRRRLFEACFRQRWVGEAPVIIVCLVGLAPNAPRPYLSSLTEAVGGAVPASRVGTAQRAAMTPQRLTRETARLRDAAIAIEHICLQAVELGLGTCWIGLFDEPTVKEVVNAPEDSMVAIVLLVGYPDYDPPLQRRLSLSEVAFREEYGQSWQPEGNAVFADSPIGSSRGSNDLP